MIRRLLTNLIFILIKSVFREKEIDFSQSMLGRLETFEYRLIGIRPSIEELGKSLSAQFRNFQKVGFNGFTDVLAEGMIDQGASKIIHKRRLSAGEIGCARSHQIAYSLDCDADWVIFIEDDVRVVGNLSDIEGKLTQITKAPTVVAFEYGLEKSMRYPFWKKKHGTYAYALNRNALKSIGKCYTEIYCVADWPIQWIYQMDFFVVGQTALRLDLGIESLIDVDRKKIKKTESSIINENASSESILKITASSLVLGSNMIDLYRLLQVKGVRRPRFTAFLACKSGLYASGSD